MVIEPLVQVACTRCTEFVHIAQVVVTAGIATTCAMLKALNLDTYGPGGGALLSGAY